jgi:hypothetical protein
MAHPIWNTVPSKLFKDDQVLLNVIGGGTERMGRTAQGFAKVWSVLEKTFADYECPFTEEQLLKIFLREDEKLNAEFDELQRQEQVFVLARMYIAIRKQIVEARGEA